MIKKSLLTFIAFAVISFSANAELSSSVAQPPTVNNTNKLTTQPDIYIKSGAKGCYGTTCHVVSCNSGDKYIGQISRSASGGIGGYYQVSERVLCSR